MRLALWVSVVFAAMTFSTLYIGPGVGVEANCVSLQTSGRTMLATIREIYTGFQFFPLSELGRVFRGAVELTGRGNR